MDSRILLDDLDALLRETYSLWDEGWVTFNWRNYTYDHVQRVRGLATTLAQNEGADVEIVEIAALLHDITKPWDGPYLTDDAGNRVVDERGYWQNKSRPPARRNHVVDLYDDLGLAGSLHNISGARLATVLLHERGVPEETVTRVDAAIREHLRPSPDASLEARCLYDADTIDANIGMPAFVRNIYINLHFFDERKPEGSGSLDEQLAGDGQAFLQSYVGENLPRWASVKRRDFPPRLLTHTARRVADERLDRMDSLFAAMGGELAAWPQVDRAGRLAVLMHYARHRQDPSIAQETADLAQDRLARQSVTARELIDLIQREQAGVI